MGETTVKDIIIIIFLFLGFLGFIFSFGEDVILLAGEGIELTPNPIINTGIISQAKETYSFPFSVYMNENFINTDINLFGAFNTLIDNTALNPTNPVIQTLGRSKLILAVKAGSDTEGTIHIKGTILNINNGSLTTDFIENITITGVLSIQGSDIITHTNSYITDNWFIGTVNVSTTDLTLTAFDLHSLLYEQNNANDSFTIDTLDMSFLTTSANSFTNTSLFVLERKKTKKMNLTAIISMNLPTSETVANEYYRMRITNLNKTLNGTHSGFFVVSNLNPTSRKYNDINYKVWVTNEIIIN